MNKTLEDLTTVLTANGWIEGTRACMSTPLRTLRHWHHGTEVIIVSNTNDHQGRVHIYLEDRRILDIEAALLLLVRVAST